MNRSKAVQIRSSVIPLRRSENVAQPLKKNQLKRVNTVKLSFCMRHRYVVIEFDAVPPLLGLIFDHISHKLFSTRDHTCNP